MNDIEKWLDIYSDILDTLSLSSFELHYVLSIRDELEKAKSRLNPTQRYLLMQYDYQVISNAKELSEHLGEIWDYAQSKKPLSQWWWHLDSVADLTLNLSIKPDNQSNMAF